MNEEGRRKPGRPRGSVSLTADGESQILALVRGGASLPSAAQTTGIPIRTLQGWIARGSGRSKEPSTPKLRRFAREVERAMAEAKVSAEVRLHKDQPGRWLQNEIGGRGRDTDDGADEEVPDPERIRDLAKTLRDTLLYLDPTELVPVCPNGRCRCMFHRARTDDELTMTRELASKAAAS